MVNEAKSSRLELHTVLKEICSTVYFQPPNNLTMSYPCIVYLRDDSEDEYADNASYSSNYRYQITVIDRDPDTPLFDKVKKLPYSRFDRSFAVDNLNHSVFNIFF